jgi:hypothetical protein
VKKDKEKPTGVRRFMSPHPRRPGIFREVGELDAPPGWEPVATSVLPILRSDALGVSALGMAGPEEDGLKWMTVSLCRDPDSLPFELGPLFEAARAFVPDGAQVRFRTATNERGIHRVEVQWTTEKGATYDCELTEASVTRFLLMAAVASIPTIVRRPGGFLRLPTGRPLATLVSVEAPPGWERIETALGHGYHRSATTTAVLLEEDKGPDGGPWQTVRVFHYDGIPVADIASAGAAFLGAERSVRVEIDHHMVVLGAPREGEAPAASCRLTEEELGRWMKERLGTLRRALAHLDAFPVARSGQS